MPDIDLGPETESTTGWCYETSVFTHGRVHRCFLTLSFQDYDLWCRGQHKPARVAQAALQFWLEHHPTDPLPTRLDCATLRRSLPQVDTELPGRV
ncbi:MAG: hypothetical protein V3V20_10765 [Algisphaera sp.]